MLATITERELAEQMAFYQIEPWGPERADFQSAQICALLANIHRKKNASTVKPLDFMPFVKEDQPRKTAQEMYHFLHGIGKMIYGRKKKTNGNNR